MAGMNVIGTDPDKERQDKKDSRVEILEFNELLSKCDVISINRPLTEETYHSSESSFKLMNSGTWLSMLVGGMDTNALSMHLRMEQLEQAGCLGGRTYPS